MRPIIAEGFQPQDGGVFYAKKDIADKLNNMFGSKEATNAVEKVLDVGQGVNSLFQSIVLSGGIPNTPVNSFGIMQLMKETMAGHPIKAAKAFAGGMSKDFSKKFFTEKADVMKLMARNGVDVRVDLDAMQNRGYQRAIQAVGERGKRAGINQAWDEVTNDATFKRFMPMLEVQHFETVYKQGLKKGLDEKQAAKIAGQSTQNFYGKTSTFKSAARAGIVDKATGTFLFAPRFRESMLNFWIKNAKTVDPRGGFKNFRSPEYRDNAKFLVSAAVLYGAYDMANVALNDQHLWENPDGKKLS